MRALGGKKLSQKVTKLLLQDLESPSLASLPSKRICLFLDLRDDVGYAAKIRFCTLKPGFGGALARAKFRDTGCFLDQVTAIGGLCRENLADAALLDDRVMSARQTRAGKEVCNVAKPTGFAVKLVFALAG